MDALLLTELCAGCTGGVGKGRIFGNGLGGGGGHGGKGGDGYYNGSFIEGGGAYGDADIPCELGSGSGNNSLAGATAGGGIIGKGSNVLSLYFFFLSYFCVYFVFFFYPIFAFTLDGQEKCSIRCHTKGMRLRLLYINH